MTGLLHRLATRAAGTAWTVRSDVRPPYGAEGFNRPQDNTALPSTEAAVPEPRPTEQAALVKAGPEQAVPPRARSLAAAVPPDGPQPAAAAPAPDARADTVAAIAPMASLRTSDRPRSPPPLRSEEPAPLLPPRSSTSDRAAPQALRGATGLAIRPAAHGGAGQETEVHIHIGRIDVTALQEAPRPKARPRERAQPVSLDAYLAGRK